MLKQSESQKRKTLNKTYNTAGTDDMVPPKPLFIDNYPSDEVISDGDHDEMEKHIVMLKASA